ncbi:MAG TPA: 7-cyano-7-deazaguanine synthase [Vicinamibacterales bacterium]|nr:7-cyano-7-deazaguanine synthase [Vicinamibacterales bacterium]
MSVKPSLRRRRSPPRRRGRARAGGASRSLVLASAGLDSAVLIALEARARVVQPFYVRTGLAWEAEEQRMLARLAAALASNGRVLPPVHAACDMRDVYRDDHWAVRGTPPGYHTPDEDVYLDGRNIVLLAKAAVYAAREGIERLALGPLAGNPFPDATPAFFSAMRRALSLGLDARFEIATPLAGMHKADVVALGRRLGVPFELTLSCMNPRGGRHCGRCSKCRERIEAFREAGLADPAIYLRRPGR